MKNKPTIPAVDIDDIKLGNWAKSTKYFGGRFGKIKITMIPGEYTKMNKDLA